MNIIKNTITHNRISRQEPNAVEFPFDEGTMIVEMDIDYNITYTNRKFVLMSGYSKDELIGSPHSIVRHPSMPIGLFEARKKITHAKKVWSGYVKNLRKDGKHFWSLLFVQPKLDKNGNIVGYIANRKPASKESCKEAEKIYATLSGEEHIDHDYYLSGEFFHTDKLIRYA